MKFVTFRWWDNRGSRAEIRPRDTELRFRSVLSRFAVLFSTKETFSEGRNRKFWQKHLTTNYNEALPEFVINIRTFFQEEIENLKATGNLKCTLGTRGHLRKSFAWSSAGCKVLSWKCNKDGCCDVETFNNEN